MKGARDQELLDELAVTTTLSTFDTIWYARSVEGVVSYMVM